MNKSIRLEILQYLEQNNATDVGINILPVISDKLHEQKHKNEVSFTLDSMVEDGLIICNKSQYDLLTVTFHGGLPSKIPPVINARITVKGEKYLSDKKPKEATFNIQGSNDIIIGDGNQRLEFSHNQNTQSAPKTTPNDTPSIKDGLFTKKTAISIAIGVAVAIIIAVLKGWIPYLN